MLTKVEIADWTRGYRFSNHNNILTPSCGLFLLPHIYHAVKDLNFSIILQDKDLNFSIILQEQYYDII